MNIHNYPLTATQINDEDYYDVDYWTGTAYESRKVSGATLKQLFGTVAKREVVEFINKTGAPLVEGTIVYIKSSSSSGTHPEVELADASTEATSTKTVGAVYATTPNDEVGLIVTSGEVDNLDTSMYNTGDRLWLSTSPGQVTTVMPTTPDHAVFIGTVTRSQNGNGRILYHIQNGFEVEELHNMSNTSVTTAVDTDEFLLKEASSGLWKKLSWLNAKKIVTDANLTTTDITTNNVSTTKHGFAPKAPNDGTKFLDGLGAYDTVKDSDLSLSDITTNDVSTTKHGFVPKAPNDTAKFLRGDGTWATTPAGGLTYFTEAQNTAAPNATVPVDSLTAVSSTTNADFAIVPKGTGAILANIPDNTATGGNKRGVGAVDLQMSRTSNDRVASGNYSAILGGQNSAAIGTGSLAFNGVATGTNSIGFNGTASNTTSIAMGGRALASGQGGLAMALGYIWDDAIASGDQSIAIAAGARATGAFSTSFGGENCTADGTFSYAFGRRSNTFGITGRQVRGHRLDSSNVSGECQKSEFYLGIRTTGNTATTLTVAGNAASSTNQVILSNQSAYGFTGTIVGKQSGSTNACMWKVTGLIARGANAASTTLTFSSVDLVSNAPGWGTPTLAADTTNGGLRVQVIGAAATNIQWTCTIETTEVIYA